MDLGIKGNTAIVCASSRGLGFACAYALAEAGVNLVVNGLDQAGWKPILSNCKFPRITATVISENQMSLLVQSGG